MCAGCPWIMGMTIRAWRREFDGVNDWMPSRTQREFDLERREDITASHREFDGGREGV